MSTPNRKKLICKHSSTIPSQKRGRNNKSKMGRPRNDEMEKPFTEALRRNGPGMNLDSEIQVRIYKRFWRVRGEQQSSVGLAALYAESGCENIYQQLLNDAYLSIPLSSKEETRFISNVDWQFMIYFLEKKIGKAEWSAP